MTEEQLIAKHLELNPHKPTLAEAWLKESGVSVWALVGALPAVNYDLVELANSYDVPLETVEAAMAYYRRHKWLIDARLEANKVAVWPYAKVAAGV